MKLGYDLKKLYMDAFAPQAGEKITFINDFPRENATPEDKNRSEMTAEWLRIATELGEQIGFKVESALKIEPGNTGPIKDIMDSWGEKDIVIAITGQSITFELITRLPKQRFRLGSAPGVLSDFEGFKADYSRIPLRFEVLTSKMARAASAEMCFRLEDVEWRCTFDLRGERFIYNENGQAHAPGDFLNLPSGCANIAPYKGIEGDVRGKSRTEGQIPAIIDDELIVYDIKENRIVEVMGEGDAAGKERKSLFESETPEMPFITKLGLGVNEESRCNGTHIGDEKTMGMHWGYGPKKHFPDTYWCEHPIDMDIDFVYPDGSREPVFRNSIYTPNLGELFV